MHPKPRKVLQLLRLRQVNNGVFLKLNKATLQMLKLVEPYVTWGTPNIKTVRELIYKRGFLKIKQQRLPITDNKIIRNRLAHHGCVCVEDVIHEIFTVGPKFANVNRAIWAFQLNPPNGGYRRINKHYNDGGDFGNREDRINALVQSMN
jgi:60S ribosomal protein uL30